VAAGTLGPDCWLEFLCRSVPVKLKPHPLAAVAVAMLLGGCATPPATPAVQPFRTGVAPGELVHKDSGFVFPPRLGSFLRSQAHQYDDEGRDISVGYSGEIPSAVTVYVYPNEGRTLEADLVTHSANIIATYPGATILARRHIEVTPGGVDAEAVSFSFTSNFMGTEQPLRAELVLAQHGSRFVKYRITYPVHIADLAGEDSGKFLHHFSWP
jgi:hypothetical protein